MPQERLKIEVKFLLSRPTDCNRKSYMSYMTLIIRIARYLCHHGAQTENTTTAGKIQQTK